MTPLLKIQVDRIVLGHQQKVMRTARTLAKRVAQPAVKKAERKHVWINRTGQAERTLNGGIDDGSKLRLKAIPQPKGFYLYVAHGAIEERLTGDKAYGYYLETMQGGRFSILPYALKSVWSNYLKLLEVQGKNFYNGE